LVNSGAVLLIPNYIVYPEDVSSIACNNMTLNSYLFPPFTGIRLPYREMGGTAVEILVKSMKTGNKNMKVKAPNKIIERQSCRKV